METEPMINKKNSGPAKQLGVLEVIVDGNTIEFPRVAKTDGGKFKVSGSSLIENKVYDVKGPFELAKVVRKSAIAKYGNYFERFLNVFNRRMPSRIKVDYSGPYDDCQ